MQTRGYDDTIRCQPGWYETFHLPGAKAYNARRAKQRCPNLASLPIYGKESKADIDGNQAYSIVQKPNERQLQAQQGSLDSFERLRSCLRKFSTGTLSGDLLNAVTAYCRAHAVLIHPFVRG